ncbi:hypothetical protein FDECE_11233 [Fusarium decemcellulare]|nr:hypothetical protein FDECE_11233 [Fusarium decemcellulare]
MQAILALSSLHLAHLKPDEWRIHWSQGIELYQMALTGANKEMQRASDENRAALFLFSALTCYFSLSRSCCGDRVSSPTVEEDDDFLEWVFLFRGTRSLITPPGAAPLELGPLAPMIEIGKGRVRLLNTLLATDPVELKVLSDLQAKIRNRVAEGTELAAYDDAIHLLRRSYTAVHHQLPGGLQNTDIFMWLFEVSHEFISLLRLRKPIAMALFACFSVLFRQLHTVWWVGNWSDWVLSQTYRALGAEEADLWLVNGVKEVAESG